jgi:hypothetical protein
MIKTKDKTGAEQKLIGQLKRRIKLLQAAKQHYQQNPALASNVRIANIELVQNDIEALKNILSVFLR